LGRRDPCDRPMRSDGREARVPFYRGATGEPRAVEARYASPPAGSAVSTCLSVGKRGHRRKRGLRGRQAAHSGEAERGRG